MEYAESRWQDIYKTLQVAGFDVYSPGQHEGECLSPYVVVKDDGLQEMVGLSSNQQFFDILCYVPAEQYSTLSVFVAQVENALKTLEPMIMPVRSGTSSFYDDTVKGHMISRQYRNYRKITH